MKREIIFLLLVSGFVGFGILMFIKPLTALSVICFGGVIFASLILGLMLWEIAGEIGD